VNVHDVGPEMPAPFADALTEAVYAVEGVSVADGVNVARRVVAS
jgi:hypothetical protein